MTWAMHFLRRPAAYYGWSYFQPGLPPPRVSVLLRRVLTSSFLGSQHLFVRVFKPPSSVNNFEINPRSFPTRTCASLLSGVHFALRKIFAQDCSIFAPAYLLVNVWRILGGHHCVKWTWRWSFGEATTDITVRADLPYKREFVTLSHKSFHYRHGANVHTTLELFCWVL